MFDEAKLRALIVEAVREVVRDELGRTNNRAEYLDIATAASVASVTPKTIRTWISGGRLNEYRAGRELRVLRSELDATLVAGRSRPDPELAALSDLSRARKAG